MAEAFAALSLDRSDALRPPHELGNRTEEAERVWPDRRHTRNLCTKSRNKFSVPRLPNQRGAIYLVPGCRPIAQHTNALLCSS
jgi:hypothetical protein